MLNITIETVKSNMPKNSKGNDSDQKKFLINQTSDPDKGKKGNLLKFCAEENWQAAAVRAADAYFAKIGEQPPINVAEKIGYGLIALAGQNPHYKSGWKRGGWEKNPPETQIGKALEAAVIAAGAKSLLIENLPDNLKEKLTQSSNQNIQHSQKSDAGTYVPSDAEIETAIETICQRDGTEEVDPSTLQVEIEEQARKNGKRLHPEWMNIVKARL